MHAEYNKLTPMMSSKKTATTSTKIRHSYGGSTTPKNPGKISQGKAMPSTSTFDEPQTEYEEQPPAGKSITSLVPNLMTLIPTAENKRYLPTYTMALARPDSELLPADELDSIQAELELLLSTVALRYRSIKEDLNNLDGGNEKTPKKSDKSATAASAATPLAKRKRDESAKKAKVAKRAKVIKAKIKKLPVRKVPPPTYGTDESLDAPSSSQPRPMFPKNDVPTKFWLSVEPYCMSITHEDIKFLDDLINEYNDKTIPEIPELGPHFAQRWASEDLCDEQDNSNENAKANKRFASAASNEINAMLDNAQKAINASYIGPITQRILSSIMEVNNVDPNAIKVENDENAGPIFEASTSQSRQFEKMLQSGVDVEHRLKKELFDMGFLDEEDCVGDDEIMNELTRVRVELKAISEFNQAGLRRLKTAALQDMKRLEIKAQLDVVDQKVHFFLFPSSIAITHTRHIF